MSASTDILDLICDIVKNDIQSQLTEIRASRAFDGKRKPIGGGYVGAISNRKNTGNLYNSVTVVPVQQENQLGIEISFPSAEYWKWVNYGRRGKDTRIAGNSATVKYPPLSAIKAWIAEKGLPQFRDKRGRFMTNKARAFLIQRSIGEYGIFPTLFLQKGLEASKDRVVYYLGEYGRTLIENIINEQILEPNN